MQTRFTRWLLVLPAVLSGVVLLAAPASGEKPQAASDAFFKEGRVVKMWLDLDNKSLNALRAEPRKYAKGNLKTSLDGQEKLFKDVGVHVKGAAGSFRGIDDKPCLTFNLDKFGVDQVFHGMEKFHLSNSVQDGSFINELLCGELFRAAGVPASRVSHVYLTINGRPRGLFYLKEGYDKYFRMRHFGNKDGNFYDGGFLRDIDQPLQLVSGQGDVPKHGDLKALLAACQERDLKVRFEKLEKLLALDRFVSFLVLEVLCWDWDGYPMNRNNYRIYHDPKQDKLTFIPSGMDQMFNDPNGTILPGFQGVAARALLETPEGRKRYLARMGEVLEKVYRSDLINKRLDDLEKQLKPAFTAVDAGYGREFPNQVRRIRDLIKQREKSAREQLARIKK